MIYFNQRALIFAFFMAVILSVRGQSLENVKTIFDGERVTITYDLNSTDVTQKFKVAFYSSHNNYSSPIISISGDLGENILPGKTKRVTWDVRKELPIDFDNDITIKVKATKIISLVKLSAKSLAKSGYKKGKTIDMQWQGGKPADKITIELLKDGAVQQKLAENLSNSNQSFKWEVPKELKGKGYSLKVSNTTEQSNSTPFRIKPKVPLLFIIAPVVIIGGAIAFLSGDKPPTDHLVQTADDLPGPIKP